MGQSQDTLERVGSARIVGRARPRVCLRKGCAQTYLPLRWNQRYCRDLDCLCEVRRWQAAKRQRNHRRSPKNRQRHASAEAARRQRQRESPKTAGQDKNSSPQAASERRAWSRSKNNSPDFCDRPGCYETRRTSHRAPSRYCGDDCRQAIRRVRDRERKWLRRNRVATFVRRAIGRGTASHLRRLLPGDSQSAGQADDSSSVGDYRASACDGLSYHSHQPRENHHGNDRKTDSCQRPRSPPTE